MKTLQEQLITKGFSKDPKRVVKKTNALTSNKSAERLTSWELAELMGSNRNTYRRAKGGAIRRNR